MLCPPIGKGRPQLSVIAGYTTLRQHDIVQLDKSRMEHYKDAYNGWVPGAGRHHSVKWVLRYSIEGKGR